MVVVTASQCKMTVALLVAAGEVAGPGLVRAATAERMTQARKRAAEPRRPARL